MSDTPDTPDTPDITNRKAIEAWSTAPRELAESFGDEDDFARRHLLKPAIFALLGDVAGKLYFFAVAPVL